MNNTLKLRPLTIRLLAEQNKILSACCNDFLLSLELPSACSVGFGGNAVQQQEVLCAGLNE